jgi:ABC-type uncharacterized transport system substrate-binding protein
MKRSGIAWLVVCLGLAVLEITGPTAQAQNVTIVLSSQAAPYRTTESAIRAKLQEQGRATSSLDLKELIQTYTSEDEKTTIFVAIGTQAAVWLHSKKKDSSIPLFYCMVSEPDRYGLTSDPLAYGVSTNVPIEEEFKLIRDALPKTRTIGMLYQSKTERGKKLLKEVQQAVPKDWRLQAVAVEDHRSISDAIEALFDLDCDIIWTRPNADLYDKATVKAMLLASLRRQTPIFGFSSGFVRAGALLGVALAPKDQGDQIADMLLRWFRQPQKNPVDPRKDKKESRQQAPKFQIAVNLIVAQKMEIQLPQNLIRRAAYKYGNENYSEKPNPSRKKDVSLSCNVFSR